ncbi:hypothetical protein BJ742DRAFT_668096, partial [Cladochytrium replicatum]
VFSIEGQSLKLESADHVAKYVEEIRSKDHVEVRLSGNTLGVDAARAIAAALKEKHNLKVVNLSDIFTGRLKAEIPLALEAFVDALVDKKFMTDLDLSDNAFGPIGAAPLTELLKKNTAIQNLRLNNNGLGIDGGKLVAQALTEAAEQLTSDGSKYSLRSITIGRNRMETPGATHIAKALAKHTKLEEVRIFQNSIRPEGCAEFVRSLAACSNLRLLDMQDNTFTEPGSFALAETLPIWKELRVLNVNECLLKAPGARAVLEALKRLENIEQLLITFNEIDILGAKLIPSVLKNKKKLQRIELNGNCFDPDGNEVEAIRDTLRELGVLDGLDELDEMEFDQDEDEDEDKDELEEE